MLNFDDVRIGVENHGDSPAWDATFFWDGKPIVFRVRRPDEKTQPITVIPPHIAYEFFAVEIREDGKMARATERKPDEKESQFERKLGGLAPKVFLPQRDYTGEIMKGQDGRTLGSYGDDPAYVDWFTNKVKFKLKRIPVVTTAEEWAKL